MLHCFQLKLLIQTFWLNNIWICLLGLFLLTCQYQWRLQTRAKEINREEGGWRRNRKNKNSKQEKRREQREQREEKKYADAERNREKDTQHRKWEQLKHGIVSTSDSSRHLQKYWFLFRLLRNLKDRGENVCHCFCFLLLS
jgi:hypothetical protein